MGPCSHPGREVEMALSTTPGAAEAPTPTTILLTCSPSTSPGADQLITVPGAFDRLYRFGKPMRGSSGDPRVTGSIAYELILVSRGVTQYMYTSNPHLWDIVGAALPSRWRPAAALMVGRRSSGPMGLFPSIAWRKSNALVDEWREGNATLRDLRRWARPLILGAPPVADVVSRNMTWRRDPALRLRFWWARRKRRRQR